MEVTRSKLGWIPKTRLVDSNAESSVHARAAAYRAPANGTSNKKAPTRWGVRRATSDTTSQQSQHFEARRGEAEEEGTRGDRRHG